MCEMLSKSYHIVVNTVNFIAHRAKAVQKLPKSSPTCR